VAGTVRILKDGEVLFRAGEKADSMYIVRKGALKVYFLKGNEEVQLALLSDGAIVGEMAFFDQKPRSAHVKALAQTEVTEISRSDFDKLLTQIPKWLVTMMQSLSGRLRTTNEKLAVLEKVQKGTGNSNDYPFIPMVRTLRILQLLTLQLGQKEGTAIFLDYQTTLEWWLQLTGWSRDYFSRFIGVLQKQGMVQIRGEGAPRIFLTARARMQAFTDFIVELQPRVTSESLAEFSPLWIEMLESAIAEATESGYESYNVSALKLSKSAEYSKLESNQRLKIAEGVAHWLKLKHTKSSVEILLKISPKDNKNHVVLLKLLQAFLSERLDRIE
jgi:CRP-like cAMP-binding protein